MAESLLLRLPRKRHQPPGGITSHGLRHERLNEIYQAVTGQASPIKTIYSPGGDNENKTINSQMDQIARQEIAEIAGHSRLSIASAYIGSHS